MKTVLRITRTSHLLGAALVAMALAACADQPTSPVGPQLDPATVGSIIKSSVVTSTTLCRPSGECSSTTKYSEISEKIGSGSTNLRAAMGLPGGERQSSRIARPFKARVPKNVHVSGRTLYADADNDDGTVSHLELTGDGVAKGKLSGMRLSRDGKPLVAVDVKWKDVGGVSYRKHTDVTLYSGGRVAMHQERDFSPIAVVAGSPSDLSAVTLTLSNDAIYPIDGSGGDGSGGADCPYTSDVCYWLKAYNPVGGLNQAWSALEGVADSVSNWWNGMWAGADSNTAAELAETMMLVYDVYTEPSFLGAAAALMAIAEGGVTSGLLDALADDISAELLWFLMVAGM